MSKIFQSPSACKTSFDCPFCGTYTTQHWHGVLTKQLDRGVTPQSVEDKYKKILKNGKASKTALSKIEYTLEQFAADEIFKLAGTESGYITGNINLSECYNCNKFSVWVDNDMVFPVIKTGNAPSKDLPEDVLSDFEEARQIIRLSPRGAAALLRLALQKLCIHLGEKGKNINEDISSLVSKGLDPIVQQSLDAVRVIGNNAVHPGEIDLQDDAETVESLLMLINFICDRMITHPQNVQALFDKLPQNDRDNIEKRNNKVVNN